MEIVQRYIFTGGPGSGKSTTLAILDHAGYVCVPEVARHIIRDRLRLGLSPRPEPVEFAQEMFAADLTQYDLAAERGGPIFFDRGLPDSLGMLHESSQIELREVAEHLTRRSYAKEVFFFPPWAEIYASDAERDQTFAEALDVAHRIEDWYRALGFDLVNVPLLTPESRAKFILSCVRE